MSQHEQAFPLNIHDSNLPMWIFDQKTLEILDVNDGAIKRYGYDRREFLLLTVLDIRPADSISTFLHSSFVHPHATTEPEMWLHRDKAGDVFPVRISSREIAFRGRKAEAVQAEPLRLNEAIRLA